MKLKYKALTNKALVVTRGIAIKGFASQSSLGSVQWFARF